MRARLPDAPQSFGDVIDTPWIGMPGYVAGFPMPRLPIEPTVRFRNDGSVTLETAIGDLRPQGAFVTDDDELVIVVDDPPLSSISGTWRATVRGHGAVYGGTLAADVTRRDMTSPIQAQLLSAED